jgi:deoxyribose-phosphate aldolase
MDYTVDELAKLIDYSLLSPNLTDAELESGIQTALDYDVASICIMPYYLRRCAAAVTGTEVKASTTIGFPHGAHTKAIKVAEAQQALEDGGEELDLVVNIGKVLSHDWNYVRDEVKDIVDLTHQAGGKLKLIFENFYLNDDQKIRLCEMCGELNVDWAKTSTGYAEGMGTMDDFALMIKHCPSHVQVKAAGGVPDLDTLLTIREMGLTRVGKRSVGILDEAQARLAAAPG